MHRIIAILTLLPLSAMFTAAEVRRDMDGQGWTFTTATTEYRLRQEGTSVRLDYFGPSGKPAWRSEKQRRVPSEDIAGLVDGQLIHPGELELELSEMRNLRPEVQEIHFVYNVRRLPLSVDVRYATWGDTGVITRQVRLTNKGARSLRVERLPELYWRLPAGDYELTYLWGGWGQEKQVATEPLRAGQRVLASTRGRSTSIYSPWFALQNKRLGVYYLAELAYSGNWKASFERMPGTAAAPISASELAVSLGTLADFEGPLALPPSATRVLPEVAFTTSAGDLDDAANQLHRYQRRYVFPRQPANDPLLVQFNSWYPFPGKMTVAEMKRCADVAAELGTEVFVLDAGWYNQKDWSKELGDYQVDRVAYPNGLEELAQYVHGKGMKFGIWVEIENIGTESRLIKEHPDWCLSYNGKPLLKGVRYMLDFSKPQVRAWARGVIDQLMRTCALDWIKIDYNIDIGAEFDPASADRPGSVLLDHVMNYYAWLDEVRGAYPKLVIENCSSGGLRFDSGIMRHTHTTWLSDVVDPVASVQLAYGCTLAFSPQVCNHWMVGDTHKGEVDLGKPEGWWDFMFRVPMNGQYGISSRVFDWSGAMKKRSQENVALYKRIRPVIKDADVYHLTPPPPNQNPAGWMALQYVTEDRKKSVVTAYRLGQSSSTQSLKLRGLSEGARYSVMLDGQPAGTFTQQSLAQEGLPVKLDAEWRAAVVELEAR